MGKRYKIEDIKTILYEKETSIMKNKKQQLKSALSTLALALALAGNLALPGTLPEDPNPIPSQIPVEEETPEGDEDDWIRPLTDMDRPISSIETVEM